MNITHHSFNVDIAQKYGIEEAVIINNIAFWMTKNIASGENIHNGRCWVFNSVKAWCVIFPYINQDRMRRVLDSMCKRNILAKDNFNEAKYDRTSWYTIIEPSICEMYQIQLADLPIAIGSVAEPIPVINSIINTINTLETSFPQDTRVSPTKTEPPMGNTEVAPSEEPKPKAKKYAKEAEVVVKLLNDLTGSTMRHDSAGHYKYVSATLTKGYSLEDMEAVVRDMVKQWKGTEYEKYLVPKTLFNDAFDGRLSNAKKRSNSTPRPSTTSTSNYNFI